MSAYEPGTVGVATVRGVPNVRVIRADTDIRPWFTAQEFDHEYDHSAEHVTDVRPLVVLDLALTGDDAARLTGIANRHIDSGTREEWLLDSIAQQIAEQAMPPKPAEPAGLGAVVEDAEGVCWIRTAPADTFGIHWVQVGTQGRAVLGWRHIDAVRVLSEGVTA